LLAAGALKDAAPPGWFETLEMAAQWGIPPWRVEDESSARWTDRWVAWRNAKAPRPEPGPGKRRIT
jgi:hypothetical protein